MGVRRREDWVGLGKESYVNDCANHLPSDLEQLLFVSLGGTLRANELKHLLADLRNEIQGAQTRHMSLFLHTMV